MKNREWKTFSLGDDTYFTLHSTLNGIDKNKLVDSSEKKYPYITRSKNSNGLDMFVSKQPQDINKGNVIIIGLDTQTVFYQESDFYTGQNVQILYNEHLTKNIAFFLMPIIKKQLAVLNWGGNGATLGRLKKKKVVLPIKDDNTPDWDFMEEHIRGKFNQIKDTYKIPGFHEISDERELNEVEWRAFLVKDYFNMAKSKSVTHDELPLISAKKDNNGYKEVIKNPRNQFEKGIITWNKIGDGGAGLAYYHDYTFTMDSINVLAMKSDIDISKYSAIFITRLLSQYFGVFRFGNTLSMNRFRRTKFMLPVKNNQPDFDFMEQYMKRMENNVLEKAKKMFE